MEKGERVPGEKVTSTYCHLDHFRSLLDEIEKSTGSFKKERKRKKKEEEELEVRKQNVSALKLFQYDSLTQLLITTSLLFNN